MIRSLARRPDVVRWMGQRTVLATVVRYALAYVVLVEGVVQFVFGRLSVFGFDVVTRCPGVPDEVPDATIQQILSTVRLAGSSG